MKNHSKTRSNSDTVPEGGLESHLGLHFGHILNLFGSRNRPERLPGGFQEEQLRFSVISRGAPAGGRAPARPVEAAGFEIQLSFQ